jgi:hypothetical protein
MNSKILFINAKTFWLGICYFVLLLTMSKVNAQNQNSPIFYVADFGETYFSQTNNFDTSFSETVTSRTAVSHGKILFASGVEWYVASDNHFIDGYAHTHTDDFFIFPIGQLGIYAPLKVMPTNTSGISAAYFRNSPVNIGSIIAPSVAILSDTEYWLVEGALALPKITLSWRSSSNVASLTNNLLTKLTVAGWNGSEWLAIASTIDYVSLSGEISTLDSGSISTIENVDLTIFSAFSLAKRGDICLPYIASSGNVKIWNGTWNPSEPTLNDPVIINASFSGNLLCNSLVLNADITLFDTNSVEIVNGVSGAGKIIMSSEASLVQHNSSSLAPKIELTKITNPMRRYDYVFLSSPIDNGEGFYANLTSNNNVAVNGNYGSQPQSAFSNFKTLNQTGQQVTTTSFTIGKGFRALVRNQAPFSTTSTWATEKKLLYIKAVGTAINGDVTIDLPANNWTFIGNPYPSAIDNQMLLDASDNNLGRTIYYWTYNSPMSTLFTYNINDWATWTSVGGTSACITCDKPDGSIASMQSVYIKSVSNNPTTFNFTNCMRKTQGNSNFYRTVSNNRFWVNMTGSNGSFNQILLAYSPDTVVGEDASDGLKMTGTNSALSSSLNNLKYAIQGRGIFDVTDIVPLVIDKTNSEQFVITIGEKEGIFEGGSTPIYLHDNLLGIYHNLGMGAYSFIQNASSDSTRFSIVYANSFLNNPDNTIAGAVAFINNATLVVSASSEITKITIFDMVGRQVVTYGAQNSNALSSPFHQAQGIYIAKIILQDGTVVSQKLFNK